MMTREEMTDICCMELMAGSAGSDMRKSYRRCAEIAQNRGCSDRVFADAWNNAVQWFGLFGRKAEENANASGITAA